MPPGSRAPCLRKSDYEIHVRRSLCRHVVLVAGGVDAQTHLDTTVIDQAVISKLSAQFGINSKVITHLDLTQPFQTNPSGASSSLNSLMRKVASRTEQVGE